MSMRSVWQSMGDRIEPPPKPRDIDELEFVRTLTPYVFSRRVVTGKSVLDVGCGLGHGSWLLVTSGAKRVTALDIDEHNARQVPVVCADFDHCDALVMDGQALGLRNRQFETVTCFEVIEHVGEPDILLVQLQRVLSTDGVLLLTTPNRSVRLLPLQRPWNPEHLREYTVRGLHRILEKHFSSFVVLGIRGEPAAYAYYRTRWQQEAIDLYVGWLVRAIRRLAPHTVRRWLRTWRGRRLRHRRPGDSSTALGVDYGYGTPPHEDWPFHVGDVTDECLNFFVICGFHDQIVQRAVSDVVQST